MLSNPHDKPILSDRTQTADRFKIEQRFKSILPHELLASLKSLDPKIIPKIIQRTAANNCWGLWLAGIKHGRDHAQLELKLIGHESAKFALLDERDPPSRMQNKRAEDAVWERVNTLAGNIADTEWERIQAALVENVQGDSSRSDLQATISDVLGGDRFRARSETIARTELTAAYNTGRIQTYRDNNIQAVRRYCIRDERTCEQCAGLNGMVAQMSDAAAVARLTPPQHPNCRCTISPLIDIKQLADANRQTPPTTAAPWMMGRIIAAISD